MRIKDMINQDEFSWYFNNSNNVSSLDLTTAMTRKEKRVKVVRVSLDLCDFETTENYFAGCLFKQIAAVKNSNLCRSSLLSLLEPKLKGLFWISEVMNLI